MLKNFLYSKKSTSQDDASPPISAIFEENVFTLKKAENILPKVVYQKWACSITQGTKIDRKSAQYIADALREWAMSKGVTHYTHWFQPLTGTTAEKHQTFFTIKRNGRYIEELNAHSMIQQEPDASSFPSGGLRATFEARGYSAWDPSSPSFIMETGEGKTLCIPTVFIAYTGEALDYKSPLLKTISEMNKVAVEVCRLLDEDVQHVKITLGWEQEYFIIDEKHFKERPDLLLTNRTLVGSICAKGQNMEDHYFGSIPEKVYDFMRDLETESYKLGIPLSARHNEVAPSQYEFAPIFEEVNIAVDHNCLFMDLMERIAQRHGLRVLLHEKPFAGLNGSGKHNNWSLATDTGLNLLSPGKTPKKNLLFLTFFINVIKSVYDYAEVLRASIASAGNDHRLGANEAPPAIMSVFIGSHLTNILQEIEHCAEEIKNDSDDHALTLDIHKIIPDLLLDNTDRNRTSPFAFTGNKFEFRAVGSSANCSSTLTCLNSMVITTLKNFLKEVEIERGKGIGKEKAIWKILKYYIETSKNILFEGDGYTDEWKQEAQERGLKNVSTTPLALDALISEKAKKIYVDNGILSPAELHAHHAIELEKYFKKVSIEVKVLKELCYKYVLPSAFSYQHKIARNLLELKSLGYEISQYINQSKLLTKITQSIENLQLYVEQMDKEIEKLRDESNLRDKAIQYADKVVPFLSSIRKESDELESKIDYSLWQLPKYTDMLFVHK
ncbi:MAG: glutamine synthetase III [Chitinophagaceae bacterium]